MEMITTDTELLQTTIDKFWESVPHAWHTIRANIRETAAQDFEITVEQFHILRLVAHELDSISELARAKQISRPAVSQAVDVLVNKGLLTRGHDKNDRRYVRLELTEDGTALLKAIFERNRSWMLEKFSTLPEEDLLAMQRAFQALREMFEQPNS